MCSTVNTAERCLTCLLKLLLTPPGRTGKSWNLPSCFCIFLSKPRVISQTRRKVHIVRVVAWIIHGSFSSIPEQPELKSCTPVENGQTPPPFLQIFLRNRISGWKSSPSRMQKASDGWSLAGLGQLFIAIFSKYCRFSNVISSCWFSSL